MIEVAILQIPPQAEVPLLHIVRVEVAQAADMSPDQVDRRHLEVRPFMKAVSVLPYEQK